MPHDKNDSLFATFQASGTPAAGFRVAPVPPFEHICGRRYLAADIFIEDTSTWVREPNSETIGKWYVCLDRSEYDSDDLEIIERLLFDFCLEEGLIGTKLSEE